MVDVETPGATPQGTRTNAAGDDVVYQSSVPPDSIGFSEYEFFRRLGHPSKKVDSAHQQMEQVYLLQNMHKAGLWEAAEIALKHNIGIAVRGTRLLAHMGIESGNPTKSVEFKNKTSKPVDLLLCPELEWKDDEGIRPVSVAFYVKGAPDRVKSVWSYPDDKAWYPS